MATHRPRLLPNRLCGADVFRCAFSAESSCIRYVTGFNKCSSSSHLAITFPVSVMNAPHQFRASTGCLFSDLEVLHYGIVVQGILSRRSVFELRKHGRGGHWARRGGLTLGANPA